MGTAGIVRRLDNLGRVVLPIELRRSYGWKEHDRIEIIGGEDQIILKKYEPNCIFCGSSKNLRQFQEKLICERCVEKITNL